MEMYGTVFERLSGVNAGGRFMTSYQPELEIGSITESGLKVIAHGETYEECLDICNQTSFNKGMYAAIHNYLGVDRKVWDVLKQQENDEEIDIDKLKRGVKYVNENHLTLNYE